MLARSSKLTARCLRALLACVGGFATTAKAGDSAAPCSYSVTEAGAAWVCGGFQLNKALNPRALNNLGHWAGYRFQCLPNNDRTMAIRWTPWAGVEALPVPPGTIESSAAGINDQGMIVGTRSGTTNGQSHGAWGCIWYSDGSFAEIPPLGGCPASSAATAVNNAGDVVGWRWTTCEVRVGFLLSGGTLHELDPQEVGFTEAVPEDVSSIGIVAGWLNSPQARVAFRWHGDTLDLLKSPPETEYASAKAVNDAGVVVGYSQFPAAGGSPTYSFPTRWIENEFEFLPLPSGYSAGAAIAISDAGVILGKATSPTVPGLRATLQVVWINDIPYEIESLIDAPNASQFGTAWAVNQFGQVLGTGIVQPQGAGGAWLLSFSGSPSDLNHDCVIDGDDLALLLAEWGPAAGSSADFDGDGVVDGNDLGALLGAWTAAE